MYHYIEAPNCIDHSRVKDWQRTVFLGGGISETSNRQFFAKEKLLPHFTVFNPHRGNYVKSEAENTHQMIWEYTYLNLASIVLFYFSWETVAPITFFELGKMLEKCKTTPWKKLYICIHPEYERKNDIIARIELEDPEVSRKIRFDLDETLDLIIKENK